MVTSLLAGWGSCLKVLRHLGLARGFRRHRRPRAGAIRITVGFVTGVLNACAGKRKGLTLLMTHLADSWRTRRRAARKPER